MDLQEILQGHRSRQKAKSIDTADVPSIPETPISSFSIPDLFFDVVLPEYKLNRIQIMVLVYLYRKIWCGPNLYKLHGISEVLSHTEMAAHLSIQMDEVHAALRKLEDYELIETIRLGQYFIRRNFTKRLDEKFGQSYDDFDV